MQCKGFLLSCPTLSQRLLELVPPQSVHIMDAGRIVASGGMELVEELEQEGYAHGLLRPLSG